MAEAEAVGAELVLVVLQEFFGAAVEGGFPVDDQGATTVYVGEGIAGAGGAAGVVDGELDGVDGGDVGADPVEEATSVARSAEARLGDAGHDLAQRPFSQRGGGAAEAVGFDVPAVAALGGLLGHALRGAQEIFSAVVHLGATGRGGIALDGGAFFAETGHPCFEGGFAVACLFEDAGDAVVDLALGIAVYPATGITYVVSFQAPLSQAT